MTVTIQIDEFSTGIRPQILPDGTWVSLGFTGQYMNATRDPIPLAVQRSIANKEFAVAESGDPEKPAMVGREVLYKISARDLQLNTIPMIWLLLREISAMAGILFLLKIWSVVAIASRGQDEKGRSTSFYRYFFCPGRGRIEAILAWIARYEKKNGHLPVFNPSETKHPGNSERFSFEPKTFPTTTLVNSPSEAVIPLISTRSYYDVHRWATEKANSQSQLIAWAFNAEALEKPWNFILIHTASDRAYAILGKAAANPPRVKTPVVADEQALKSAIKQLISNSEVKRTALQTIEDALANKVPPDYWETLFESQGARSALKQKIYSPQMLRLLTLRTMVIPETLPRYLEWLQINENLGKRTTNQAIDTILKFQVGVKQYLDETPWIKSNLGTGLKYLVSCCRFPVGLFEKIGDYSREHYSDSGLPVFYYKLSVYLEQFANDKVSKKAFLKAFPKEKFNRATAFGLTIKQDIYQSEENIVRIPIVVLLMLVSSIVGLLAGLLMPENLLPYGNTSDAPEKVSNQNGYESSDSAEIRNENEALTSPLPQNTLSSSDTSTLSPPTRSDKGFSDEMSLTIPNDLVTTAEDKFNITSQVIQTTINDLEKTLKNQFPGATSDEIRELIMFSIKDILRNQSLDYSIINGTMRLDDPDFDKSRINWIDAIYSYQIRKELPLKVGYILMNKSTMKSLKSDVKDNLETSKKFPPPGS